MGGGKGGVAVQRSPFTAVVRVRFPAGAICELSLFDVLFSPLPRGFFLRVLRFFLPQQKSTCELSVVCKIFNVEVVSVSASRSTSANGCQKSNLLKQLKIY